MDIILLCRTHCGWIKNVIDSLLLKGENTNIHLLTNKNVQYQHKNVHLHKLQNYKTQRVGLLEKIYVHKNTCPKMFNLFDLQRWLYINEFIKRHNIKTFLCTDWDIVYFCDLNREQKRVKMYDFTINNKISLCLSFWNNPKALQDFTDYIMRVYSNPNSTEAKKIFSHYENRKKAGKRGGVCDMTFAGRFADESKYNSTDTYDIRYNSIFDNNIRITDEWDSKGKLKNIYFQNGKAYCYNTRVKKIIKLNCAHFFGGYKKFIAIAFKKYQESFGSNKKIYLWK